jgi:YVTN family beta-propeller protein
MAAWLASTGLAHADVLAPNTWYEFSYYSIGDPTFGCDPADPDGLLCIASGGTPTVFAGPSPWTFTLAAPSSLVVIDAFQSGDRFEVFDSGASLGETSAPQPGGDCFDAPVGCFRDPHASKRTFALGAGAHSITIGVTAGGNGGGYLRIPEARDPELIALAGLASIARLARRRRRSLGLAGLVIALVGAGPGASRAGAPAPRYLGPTSSQPIALSADDAVLAVVNPDIDSVTLFDVRNGRNRFAARLATGDEPSGVALTPDGTMGFVANAASGTVTVFIDNIRNGVVFRPIAQLPVGTEPYALCMSPNGTRLYVANARSDSVSVIDVASQHVITTILGVGHEPRGLALTNDGDADDLDETLVVTSFLAEAVPGFVGSDAGGVGRVALVSTATNTVTGTVDLAGVADTGFPANGNALARIPPGGMGSFATGAYPNQLNGVAIRGARAFVPSTAASPNGPVRFDVNVQSLLSVIDLTGGVDAGHTIDLQSAVAAQTNPARRFLTQPWSIAFEHAAPVAWVVLAASDVLAKVAVDGSGVPSVALDPQPSPPGQTRVLEIPVGKNPRGVVIDSTDSRAYVANYVSRDVTVVDLTPAKESVLATFASAPQPPPDTLEGEIHVGRELFYTAIGTFDPATPGGAAITGRMSKDGWSACSTCHPFGLSDGVVWIFGDGPRRTIPLHTDFDHPNADVQRPLGWSATADEEADFELLIRNVAGGAGLLVEADGVTPAADVTPLTPLANTGRKQLAVRGVGAWTALDSFVRYGIRPPISPVSKTDPDVVAGRALFTAANCQQCHGGLQWTSGLVRYEPPPAPVQVSNGQIAAELRNVGTFDAGALDEVRQDASAPLGASGFVPASLLSAFAFEGLLLHGGGAATFDEVLQNVQHRSAGTAGVDTLANAADRQKIAAFLRSIDAATAVFP